MAQEKTPQQKPGAKPAQQQQSTQKAAQQGKSGAPAKGK